MSNIHNAFKVAMAAQRFNLYTKIISLVLLSNVIVVINAFGASMIGPGRWRVLNVGACARDTAVRLEVTRRRVNRTHDGFQARYTLHQDLDNTYAVRVDVCKQVDGGCKPYQTLVDGSLPHFVHEYAAENARRFLAATGLQPPDFPVPAGSYEVNNFVFNYEELPRDGIYGQFGADAVVTRAGSEVACARLDVEFYDHHDHDDRDDQDNHDDRR